MLYVCESGVKRHCFSLVAYSSKKLLPLLGLQLGTEVEDTTAIWVR